MAVPTHAAWAPGREAPDRTARLLAGAPAARIASRLVAACLDLRTRRRLGSLGFAEGVCEGDKTMYNSSTWCSWSGSRT
jgi:hypothetical protein